VISGSAGGYAAETLLGSLGRGRRRFSSPGLYGFYPWIDSTKTWYGVVGRRQIFQVFDEAHPDTSAYAQSVRCSQALRAACFDGKVH